VTENENEREWKMYSTNRSWLFVLWMIAFTPFVYPAAAQGECDANHWIEAVMNDGSVVKLEDGSLWQVDSIDTITSSLWLPATDIVVCDDKLINTEDGETVSAPTSITKQP
jgi:hypothetical protein